MINNIQLSLEFYCIMDDIDDIVHRVCSDSKNNLIDVLRTLEDDPQNEVRVFADSPYLSMDEIDQTLSKYRNRFTILSLNIQSINSKFDSLLALLSILDEIISISTLYVYRKLGSRTLMICLHMPFLATN